VPWRIEHWDTDGASTFCSNGSRAALGVPGAPQGTIVEAISNGETILLAREGKDIGIRMPEGRSCGLFAIQLEDLREPHVAGWIGNPQLIVEVPKVADVELSTLGPRLRHHQAFESGTNVNVLEISEPGLASIRSWERGVENETLCCGTGCAVAAAWLAQRTGIHDWRFLPAGPDAVSVRVSAMEDGHWKDLWLFGPLRNIGGFTPHPFLFEGP
jgi:diaminopimelate epimerase